jgi:transketolase
MHLTALIDYNKIQSLDTVERTLGLEPFADKWRAFGWRVREIDGHDHAQIRDAFASNDDHAPTCVIAHTTKGKGVSFMENAVLWHYRTARGGELEAARRELASEPLSERP